MIQTDLQYRLLIARLEKFQASRRSLFAILHDPDLADFGLQLDRFDSAIEALKDELASYDQRFEGQG